MIKIFQNQFRIQIQERKIIAVPSGLIEHYVVLSRQKFLFFYWFDQMELVAVFFPWYILLRQAKSYFRIRQFNLKVSQLFVKKTLPDSWTFYFHFITKLCIEYFPNWKKDTSISSYLIVSTEKQNGFFLKTNLTWFLSWPFVLNNLYLLSLIIEPNYYTKEYIFLMCSFHAWHHIQIDIFYQ